MRTTLNITPQQALRTAISAEEKAHVYDARICHGDVEINAKGQIWHYSQRNANRLPTHHPMTLDTVGIGMTSERTRMRLVERLRHLGIKSQAVLQVYKVRFSWL